jgi:hypothetical protein
VGEISSDEQKRRIVKTALILLVRFRESTMRYQILRSLQLPSLSASLLLLSQKYLVAQRLVARATRLLRRIVVGGMSFGLSYLRICLSARSCAAASAN